MDTGVVQAMAAAQREYTNVIFCCECGTNQPLGDIDGRAF